MDRPIVTAPGVADWLIPGYVSLEHSPASLQKESV